MTINPNLIHIYGPISIHIYGTLIVAGILTALFFLSKDTELKKVYSFSESINIISSVILAAFIGARLLWALEVWETVPSLWYLFYFWNPGYSILGAIIGGSLFLYSSVKKNTLLFIDRVSIYVPLVQGFGRIGCFFTGCCYGIKTTLPWSVIYKHTNHLAPLCIPYHPTQLYSMFLLFSLFVLLYSLKNYNLKKGQLSSIFLIGTSIERFTVDFFRADRTLIGESLSFMQWIAFGLFISGILLFYISKRMKVNE